MNNDPQSLNQQNSSPATATPAQQQSAAPKMYQPQVNTVDYGDKIRFIKNVLDSMTSKSPIRPLLAGDTGLGKTSFVKQLGIILGLPLVVVEVPHIVEEEFINIPFLVKNANGTPAGTGNEKLDKKGRPVNEFDIVMSKSYMVSTLERLHKLSDAEYQSSLKRQPAELQELVAQFNRRYPSLINRVRSKNERILFLDEFYRKTSSTIRNILREILNRRIGNDVIPDGTFELYASNVEDTGIETGVSQHATFKQMQYPAPSVEQWLNFMTGGKIQYKDDVVRAFKTYLSQGELSYTDASKEFRSSPRRWSDILRHINNAYPFKNPSEVGIVKTYMMKQFENKDRELSPTYNALSKIIDYLAKRSGFTSDKIRMARSTEWRDTLVHALMSQMAIGDEQKYVPVISGAPGIGKTAIREAFERPPYNLKFIDIKTTTLSHDSITGIPSSSKNAKGKLETSFTAPPLYTLIMQKVEEANNEQLEDFKEDEADNKLGGKTAEQAYAAWQKQPYKYLIFFDEINRVQNESVFNSLRRVILEKEFNDDYKLPAGSVCVGAMNPSDVGVKPFTGHFRDAINIIDAEPDWNQHVTWIDKHLVPKLLSEGNSDLAVQTAVNIIKKFPDVFTDKANKKEGRQYYINLGATHIYMPPRTYDSILADMVSGFDNELDGLQPMINSGEISDEVVNDVLVDSAFDKFEYAFNDLFYRENQTPAPGFMDAIHKFLNDNVKVSLKKEVTKAGLGSMIDQATEGNTRLADNNNFYNYMEEYDPREFFDDLTEYLIPKYQEVSSDMSLVDRLCVSQEPGSLYNIAREIKEALQENSQEGTGAMDIVTDVSFDFFKNVNKKIVEESGDTPETVKLIQGMLDNYRAIRDLA